MKQYSLYPRQTPNLLPFILLAGLLIGSAIGLSLLNTPTAPSQPTPTETLVLASIAFPSPIAESPQVVQISPRVNLQSIARVGDPAPDFSLKTIDGDEVKLSDFNGKTVLLNLWASWCSPCRYEMPGIQAAYEKYKDRGLVVLGIDYTFQDNLLDAKAFVEEFKLAFPILIDETGEVSTGLYGMRGLPTSYFIDTEGILQRIQVGAMLPDKLEEYLTEILPK
jgi:peroxiredoxin